MKKLDLKNDNKVLKENDEIISKIANTKEKRHVKEPVEPVFKDILNDFSLTYARLVVANTTKDILKTFKNGI